MRIFLTGGTGFLGSHFLSLALKQGHELRALRRPGNAAVSGSREGIEWIEGTLGSVAVGAMAGCDALVHLAAAGVSPQKVDWETALRVNVTDSVAVVERAVQAGVKRFVFCGSCMEYGQSAARYEKIPTGAPLEPVGAYAASKAAGSLALLALARTRGLEASLLRPFHFFGEGQYEDNLWPSLKKAALAGEDFPMTEGAQLRDFMPVEEVAAVFLRALECKLEPGCPMVANVGSGRPVSLRDFARHWWKEWGAEGRLLFGALPYRENEVMRYLPGESFFV